MTTVAILNSLTEEIKDIITNGVDSSWDEESPGGSPVVGGISTGEDFDGFTIYAETLNDTYALKGVMSTPYILVTSQATKSSYFLTGEDSFNFTFSFELVTNVSTTKSISGNSYAKYELMNWYLEQLQYLMENFNTTSITEVEDRVVETINHGEIKVGNELVFVGTITLTLEAIDSTT